ncbi:hypothetical protein GW17_00056289 [Ensete ventricosum]|nr:hypothetical protein GW17_00056289 [Ensete ventricosum]RZR83793.1 hypothetical protein BHM03_00010515 [Ensete ventricosum]
MRHKDQDSPRGARVTKCEKPHMGAYTASDAQTHPVYVTKHLMLGLGRQMEHGCRHKEPPKGTDRLFSRRRSREADEEKPRTPSARS